VIARPPAGFRLVHDLLPSLGGAGVSLQGTSHSVSDDDPLRVLPGQPGHAVDHAVHEGDPPSVQCTSIVIGQPGAKEYGRK
jgi:hypothetical protein